MEKSNCEKKSKTTKKVKAEKPDYKKLFLEQKKTALQLKAQVLQYHFAQVQQELATVIQELKGYQEQRKEDSLNEENNLPYDCNKEARVSTK